MPFRFNPFTDKLDIVEETVNPGSGLVSLRGNNGTTVLGDAFENIDILGSGGLVVTGDAGTHTLTISGGSVSLTWNVVTSADNPVTLAPANGYIAKGGSAVTFALPGGATVGDTYVIMGYGNLWTITQAAGQSITLGIDTSTVGAGGSVTATKIRDSITLICVTANTEFQILGPVGNLTFV